MKDGFCIWEMDFGKLEVDFGKWDMDFGKWEVDYFSDQPDKSFEKVENDLGSGSMTIFYYFSCPHMKQHPRLIYSFSTALKIRAMWLHGLSSAILNRL